MDRLSATGAAGRGEKAAYEDLLDGRYFVLDSLGRVTRWSAGAETAFGWSHEEVVGRSAFAAPLGWRGERNDDWRARLEGGAPLPGRLLSVTALTRDALELPAELTAIPVRLSLGYEFTALVGSLADRDPGSVDLDAVRGAHQAALDAIAKVLRDDDVWPERLAGLLVTFRVTGEPERVDDPGGEDAARTLRIERVEEVARPSVHSDPDVMDVLREVDALRRRAAELEDELAELRGERAALQGELAAAREATAQELRAEVATALEERDEALARASEAEQALANVRSQLETIRVHVNQPDRATTVAVTPPAATREREPLPGLDDAAAPRAHIGLDGHFEAINAAFSRLVGYSERDFRRSIWPPVIGPNKAALRELTARVRSGELESAGVDTAYMHANGLLVPMTGTLSAEREPDGTATRLVLEVDGR